MIERYYGSKFHDLLAQSKHETQTASQLLVFYFFLTYQNKFRTSLKIKNPFPTGNGFLL